MLAEIGVKTAINIFALLASLSFALLLWEARELVSFDNSGRKKEKIRYLK